jgi:phosphatidate cytidylyltransferase
MAAILAAMGSIEFSRLTKNINRDTLPELILDCGGTVFLALGGLIIPLVFWIFLIIARFIAQLYNKTEDTLKGLSHSVLSQVWIGGGLCMLTSTGVILASPQMVLAIFFLIWINDTGAFIVGCTIGKHKLFERISPKKTWEGFFGGLIFTCIAAIAFGIWGSDFFNGINRMLVGDTILYSIGSWIGLGLIVSVFGTWGDLIESMTKRSLRVKDSGNIIPGHGGILDRIDSLLLVMPATAIYLLILSWL